MQIRLQAIYDEVQPFTRAPRMRLAAMAAAVARADVLGHAGDIVECGVWRGGNIMLARKLSPKRMCWLYDTYAGMTPPGEFDITRGGTRRTSMTGKLVCSLAELRGHLAKVKVLDDERMRFVVGPVEETLLERKNIPEKIAVLRLDTDWYESTKIELEKLYPRLVPGGIMLVDDYGHWQGARKAVDIYFQGRIPNMSEIDYTAIMVEKPC